MAGALQETETRATVVATGFVDFEITHRVDVYANLLQASSAAKYGTLGINFRAQNAATNEEWQRALTALCCST